MNLKDRMIIEEYRKSRNNFILLGDTVHNILSEIVDSAGIQILGIEHRVKTENSLIGKLTRVSDRYQSFIELTDILGARVITFFSDDVDKVGKQIEQRFKIDWENSCDKRALIKADSFGYLSLHYICLLPENAGYPEELCKLKFEIQIRTVLQHTWAAINHDIGYKSEFGVPRAIAREFSRVAGLLEIADDEFVRVRDNMNAYTHEIRQRIIHDTADDVPIDLISLREYVRLNKNMLAFLNALAAINGAEISPIPPDDYVEQLNWLHKTTLGHLQVMLEENKELALQLAQKALAGTDLDILSSSVGLRFLCRAELLAKGYTQSQAAEFLTLATGNRQRAERQAKYLFDTYKNLKGAGHD